MVAFLLCSVGKHCCLRYHFSACYHNEKQCSRSCFIHNIYYALVAPCHAIRYLVMVAQCNRADHYIFALWLLSIYLFFSSPNLSGRRLDVYHTSTHGVALFLLCVLDKTRMWANAQRDGRPAGYRWFSLFNAAKFD